MYGGKWFLKVGIAAAILLGLLHPSGHLAGVQANQSPDPKKQAQALLAEMSPEERVGQLFIITFKGREVTKNAQLIDLITRRHIGGVVLRAANNNFVGPENTVEETYRLTSALQTIEWEGSKQEIEDPVSRQRYTPQYVPLFIGISQEGGGYPYDQILSGVTILPNLMAIGATWSPDLAREVGEVLGKELSALGINLNLGPSLDVLDVMFVEGGEDLGTRTFGGDPYWVGEMGKAYIEGLHQGGNGRVAVIAKHFPGRGGSDRPLNEEVATVRKSLEQLKQIELAPFFAVTGSAPSAEATADGLLASHIRYQGFQGNIRATTRPVSFDPTALDVLMGLQPFAAWRQNSGILVSDDLGSQAVRRFYDPSGVSFDARQVARNAFLAGNDLLYADDFVSSSEPDAVTTIQRTLEFFAQKYREDAAFARRVDSSVERVLTLKFRMYQDFSLDAVLPPESGLSEVGRSEEVTFEVAQRAATLINPDMAELSVNLPRPPGTRDRIVFISDKLEGQQCTHCSNESFFSADLLREAVNRLYGPRSGAQILQYNLVTYSFSDLLKMLSETTEGLSPLEEDLRKAEWLVFSYLEIERSRPESLVLARFLLEKPELFGNKKLIVFAFDAPYFLDATNISKLTAYYGLYSHAPAFFDAAARILFQELKAGGALPVSVPAVAYDLIKATSPDPNQIIPLYLDLSVDSRPLITPSTNQLSQTFEPTPVPAFKVGDTFPLRTGIIYDLNQNPVPDGTVVRFLFTNLSEGGTLQQIETVTTQGVARAAYRIQSRGLIEARAVSDPAITSQILRLDVSTGEAGVITAIAPTAIATATYEPLVTLTPALESTPSPEAPRRKTPGIGDWILLVMIVWGSSTGVYWIGRRNFSMRWAVRWGLLAAAGGLLAYILAASGIFGELAAVEEGGRTTLIVLTLTGIFFGWGCGLLWRYWLKRRGS